MIELSQSVNTSYSLYFLIGTLLGVGVVSLVCVYVGLYKLAMWYLTRRLNRRLDAEKAIREAERIARGN